MDYGVLKNLNDVDLIEYLTQIKGVGKWTVQMLLMFNFGRKDIFPIDDLGIQNSMIEHYKLDRSDKKNFREQMINISAKWSPYRTYACLHLWRWKDVPKKQLKESKVK